MLLNFKLIKLKTIKCLYFWLLDNLIFILCHSYKFPLKYTCIGFTIFHIVYYFNYSNIKIDQI